MTQYTSTYSGAQIDAAIAKALLLPEVTTDDADKELAVDDVGSGFALVGRQIEAGTSMVFNQASAPTGWTKDASWANRASLVINNDYLDYSDNDTYSDNPVNYETDISVANHASHNHSGPSHVHAMPKHEHNVVIPRSGWGRSDAAVTGYLSVTVAGKWNTYIGGNRTLTSSNEDPGNTHENGTQNTGSASLSSHTITQSRYRPRFVQLISATKD